ncbi:hypothetical protein TARUN_7879 [Trichoderma arundinaceum]|uniref:Heterokaryon incompatibility domain-containing protein n=1 Tax=Trichoderma arundinaceum TaxID=490622 RepID=A0A395NE20_TRIAR|nr:hypothetical protein TARUN_7879 [Trichoderma arundinaceum]
MLDFFKLLVRKRGSRWCGACLFELNQTAKSLSSDIGGRWEYTFAECDYHEFSFADLIRSSKRGCDRCTALISAFEALGITGFAVARWHPNLNSPGSPFLEIPNADDTKQVFELCSIGAPLDKPVLFTEDPSLQAVLCRGYKLPRTTGDDETLDQAANWLAECRSLHDGCRISDTTFVPNRLLFLGAKRTNSNTINLVENLKNSVPYAALSHRWTEETPTKCLLTSNLVDRGQNGMPIAELPRMMQDVVSVLRRLGIEYIWIDCLCIIQDDEEDWRREAALMASVYTNAELTVAASWCDKVEQSLFRDHSGAQEVAVDVAEIYGQPIFIRRRKPHFTWSAIESNLVAYTMVEGPEMEWPLLTRGWVYQEQLLSRRMLHFTRNELIWECLEATQCECGWYNNNARDEWARQWYKQPPGSKAWADIIKGYAKRPLTVVTDKLPALAGIAKVIAMQKGYDAREYLCGLWEKELEDSFFWCLSEPPREPRSDHHIPTWSWASVSGDVECWQVALENIEFLGSNVEYRGDPLMGDVVSGMLSLSGDVVPGVIYHGQDWSNILETLCDDTGSSRLLTNWRPTEGYGLQVNGQFATFNPDYRLDLPGNGFIASGSQVLCLLFGRTTTTEDIDSDEEKEIIRTHLLILHSIGDESPRYERIGVNENCLELDTFLSLSERRQLTLV